MLSAGTTQNKESDALLNESDLLLADRYKLAKEIKDLNKTLLDSNTKMNVLEYEVKNKLRLKEQLDAPLLDLVTDKNAFSQNMVTELMEEFNKEYDFQELLEALKTEKNNSCLVKKLLMDLNGKLASEIEMLRKKIKLRTDADLEVCVVRDNLKAQVQAIQDEIAGIKPIE